MVAKCLRMFDGQFVSFITKNISIPACGIGVSPITIRGQCHMNLITGLATSFRCHRVICQGKAPRFGDDTSLTHLFTSTIEKSYTYVTNYRPLFYVNNNRVSDGQ